MNIDPKTGLPEVPEKLLWRVGVDPNPGPVGRIYVLLLERGEYMHKIIDHEYADAPTRLEVLEAAKRLVSKHYPGEAMLLTGDYPPKRLGEAG